MRAALLLGFVALWATVSPATAARGAVGTVRCCFEATIDAAPRQVCIVLNVRSRPPRKVRARRLCRLIGGKPLLRRDA
jgi:hypothetical protein